MTATLTHAAFATFLALEDRFMTGQGLANAGKRAALDALSTRLGDQLAEMYVPTTVEWVGNELVVSRHAQDPLLPVLTKRFIQLEGELGKLACEAPLTESFHTRKAPWAPSDERLDGDSGELEQSATESEREANRLWFTLHAARKSTVNRVELSKAGLTEYFSWADAWADTKAAMRELGIEIREEEAWARVARRELLLRQREIDAADKPLGCATTDGWELPSEDDTAYQARIDEGRDWSETLFCAVEISDGFETLCSEAARQRAMAHCENDYLNERVNAVDDLFDALMGR